MQDEVDHKKKTQKRMMVEGHMTQMEEVHKRQKKWHHYFLREKKMMMMIRRMKTKEHLVKHLELRKKKKPKR